MKYDDRAQKINSLVCVGLDADMSQIPSRFLTAKYPQYEFNQWVIDETHECAAAYKPNIAFYEARGDAGIFELKMTVDYLRLNYPDIFLIADAKRADIGNTNQGSVYFIFDWLGFDAVTLHPYLGLEALKPFLDRQDKYSIILGRTSNPGATEFQDLVWKKIAQAVAGHSNKNLMLVMGATYPQDLQKARALCGDMTFLIPGVGAQGADVTECVSVGKNSLGRGLIINSSRAIIFSGHPKQEATQLRDVIRKQIK